MASSTLVIAALCAIALVQAFVPPAAPVQRPTVASPVAASSWAAQGA
eukprot:CAMPEP_0171263030 /NCGR_PEP_ID=MMETSP0790-20130122/56878_1 /TAXON_ID=2925 /ORGANISM="Alexandrium catenella, Strain OF101" /LENGTH=46 /DNA_ID= /DNA_START= /DNA_END= /DNA_ORIENTATION=